MGYPISGRRTDQADCAVPPDRKEPPVPKNPLGKIKDAADLVVGQAVGQAAGAVGAVVSRVPGRKKPVPPRQERESPGLRAVPQDAPAATHGDPLLPGETSGQKVPADQAPVKTAAAEKAPAKKAPAKKAPAKKAPAKKAPAKKAPAKKAPAKKAPAKKAPAKKAPAKKLASAGPPEIPTPDETALAKKAQAPEQSPD
jgi:hypothetical protein